jgi:hypothetical protein
MSHMRKRAWLSGALLATTIGAVCLGAPAAGATSSLPTVTVAVTPSSGTVGGALQSGGVNVVTSDTGVKEADVILFRLGTGVTLAEAEAFAKSKGAKGDPNTSSKYGSIVYDVEADPGAATEAQTDLAAGEYLLLVGEGEKPVELRSHFTVTASASPVALPKAEATERSIEFAFRGPTQLHDGELVAFENEGFLVHMDIAFPVKNMKNAKRVVKDLLAGKEKALQKLIAGAPVAFAGPLSHEAMQQETITAKPGIYVQACFMETQDGRDHTLLGMERIIRITK